MADPKTTIPSDSIAIIGMAGRFPGARNVDEFWNNIRSGVESISRFQKQELQLPGMEFLKDDSAFVPARSILEDVDLFDAAFFGIYPKEAELMDPQHRVFLECCWEAMEDAGYDSETYRGAVGVFAGCSTSTYLLSRLRREPEFIDEYTSNYQVGNYPTMMGANGDFLATRVSYKLNLKGPSFTLLAGCSTSLLAVCQACQSLLTYQSDMALAGGVSITFPQKRGYLYQEGGMTSPDGHCRTFDANAQGTVFGSGSAVVLLKRLEDAIADGDHIYAIIRGSAVNNDGSAKVGYTAPSIDGQSQVIAAAQAAAGVDPESIGYIEAHGTATPLGDPIEVAALTRAFRARTQAKNFCALGTAKVNVGHLDIASGVTGLINAVNILRHRTLPPHIHFERPNPNIDLANSPFYVNTRTSDWKRGANPLRAGVSAFGVGGTNAHVVLEEAPEVGSRPAFKPAHLMLLSAKTESALDQATFNLAQHLKQNPSIDLDSVSYTLQAGRRHFDHRRILVCSSREEAVEILESRDRNRLLSGVATGEEPQIVFQFPGQGVQHPNMGLELYRAEPKFREAVDICSDTLRPILEFDLREVLYPREEQLEEARRRLNETVVTQPAIFVVEYALAQLWMDWGIQPQAMLGHSVGEFVAACLAGVFDLNDALKLIATRGQMMQGLPAGSMLAVRLAEQDVRPLLNGTLDIAAINSPQLTVVAGPKQAVANLEETLGERNVMFRHLTTSHAFHSRTMDPIIEPFIEVVKQIDLKPPRLPYISGVTGTWITDTQATDPVYWARHFREPVRFSAAVQALANTPARLLLEVGPGTTLSTLARQHGTNVSGISIVSSMPESSGGQPEYLCMMNALGRLWLLGALPDWRRFYGSSHPQRCSLPTYPFERQRYWFEPQITQPRTSVLISEDPMPESNSAPAPAHNRRMQILSIATSIFEELSGMKLAGADPATTFMEMGFDSLFLTQVTQSLQSKFGVKITFRQLLDRESSFEALTAFLDSKLPADKFADTAVTPAPSAVPVEKPVATSGPVVPAPPVQSAAPISAPTVAIAPVNGSGMEAIVREQLQAMSQLMTRQLEILAGTAPRSGTAAAAVAPVPVASVVSDVPAGPASQPAKAAPQEYKAFGPYKPLQKGTTGGLTEKQSEYLKALIARYTARTKESKRLTQLYRRPLADPRVASGFRSQWKEMVYPIITVRSRGSKLWDVDGNEYVDILNGFGPIMLGHAPDFVTEAIEKQLKDGFEIGPMSLLAGQVAERISELTGNERVSFCNTGSEAVMAAVRLARTVTGRNKVVLFSGSYHGQTDEVLVKGISRGGVPHSLPVAPGIPIEKVVNVIVLDYGTQQSLEFIRANANELAAVLVEPVQSRHPALQPREFLQQLRQITSDSGAALIFDEVVTGFRVHPGGAQAVFGIRADLATYGKVLGGGLPIGVVAGKAAFMDALDGGMWSYGDDSFPEVGVTFFAGTFVRHPLALAAADAVLKHLKDNGPELQQRLGEKTSRMVKILNDFFDQRAVPIHIENFGSIMYFSAPADQRFGSLLWYHLREKGVHALEGFPCFLTTAHSDADIEKVIRAFQETILEMQEGEALPGPSAAEGAQAPVKTQPAAAPVVEEPREAPLTESQREVWLSASLGADASCAFNESFTLRLKGRLDQGVLHESLRQVINRHDVLRATFNPQGDRVLFHPVLEIPLPLTDISNLSAQERDERIRQIIEEDAKTPFDLINGPLVRVMLVKAGEQDHSLIFTSHHIVCDGWSTNVILDELSRVYSAKCRGSVSYELEPAMRFSKYAQMEAERSRTSEYSEVEKWWTEKFSTGAPVLELPTDRPRAAVKSFQGATCRRIIGADVYKTIKAAGAQQGCTMFVTLLAGFDILLHRLTGQNDIVVGIPTAGQSQLDGETLVGHCVNFLPLRAVLDGSTPASKFLKQVKSDLLDAYEHQNYTYGSLVRRLNIPRDPSRLPLIEVQFNVERVGAKMHFEGLQVDVDANPKSFVNFDLFLNIVESDEGLVLDCDYNTDLFEESTVNRWLGHYETLLKAMAADFQRPVSKLPLLSDAERSEMLVKWNDTAAEYPKNKCVHSLFEEQAARTPNSPAVVFGKDTLTYAELNRQANQLARYLQKLGAGPGMLVALCVERSLSMMVGLLGILKSGAAYLPLDPFYPAERIAFILEDAGAALLVSQESVASGFGAVKARTVFLDKEWTRIMAGDSSPCPCSNSGEDTAYVIYTSGSTGKPKGVEIQHRALVNFLISMQRQPGIQPQDVLVAVTTLSFDIAGLELFLPLISGSRLVIAPQESTLDGSQLAALLKASAATILQATPATWRLLLEAGWKGDPHLKMLCGGEALPRDLADELLPRGASLWNMYGPTETTIWSSAMRLAAGSGPVPIGRPIANTQFYVLDSNREPVPIGVAGELYIGGDGLARGYWKRPELTEAKFVPDPFRENPAARLYRTGDLVRCRPDGTLEFLGRIDNQVKVRGFRIELGEVEAAIARYPDVQECVATVREDTPGDKRLVAYIVSGSNKPSVGELRAFLTNELPHYMIPSLFVPIEKLPQTPNGKVDRRRLPAPGAAAGEIKRSVVPPSNDREAALVKICAEVLHLEALGIDDNLFELGADSIHLFQISARAESEGIKLTPRDILQHRTVAALCAAVNGKHGGEERRLQPQIAAVSREKFAMKRSRIS